MSRSFSILAVLVLVANATRGQEPSLSEDLKAVQGNWKPVSLKYENTDTMPVDMLKQVTGVYDANEFHLYFIDRGREGPRPLKLMVAKATFDATTTPKSMTFECDRGPLKGQKLHGIYELNATTIKLCYGPVEKPKPTSFDEAKGSGCFNEVWQRQVK